MGVVSVIGIDSVSQTFKTAVSAWELIQNVNDFGLWEVWEGDFESREGKSGILTANCAREAKTGVRGDFFDYLLALGFELAKGGLVIFRGGIDVDVVVV